jgi:Zn-dependent protease
MGNLMKYLVILSAVIPKILKMTKVVKITLAVATLGSYAYMYTWTFALVLMFTIFVHEMGHLVAMKYHGLKTKGMYFIPFIGGVAIGDPEQKDVTQQAFFEIAILGPIVTFVQTAFLFGAFHLTEEKLPVLGGLAAFSALIMVFNLLPILPLDGGRVLKAISSSLMTRSAVFLGIFVNMSLVGLASYSGAYLLAFFGILGLIEYILEILLRVKDIDPSQGPVDGFHKRVWFVAKELLKAVPKGIFPMSKKGILVAIFLYMAMVLGGIYVIKDMSQYPGADVAMKLMQDDVEEEKSP